MKNLCLYLIAIMVLTSTITTVNFLAIPEAKQTEMLEWMQDFLSEFNNMLLTNTLIYLYPIRKIIVTILNMFVPLVILSAILGLMWSWWFSKGKFLGMRKESRKEASSSPHHHAYNLRTKRQKNFILN